MVSNELDHIGSSLFRGWPQLGALLTFFCIFLTTSVEALHDGTITGLFRSRHRVSFTGHDSLTSSGLKSVAIGFIPDGGRKVEGIHNLMNVYRKERQSKRPHVRAKPLDRQTWMIKHPPRIIIIGGPASGKGTQCEYIAATYGAVHLSTGDMLREAVRRNGSHVGKAAKEFMDRGELVPDDVMIQIVRERLDQEDCKSRGWLLDGFPRTKAQAVSFAEMGLEADVVLFLDVPDKDLIERIVGRRIDPVTGKSYHLKFRPPPKEIIDRLEQRSDDTIQKSKLRLEQFHSNLSEIRSHLGPRFVQIDGRGPPSEISKHVAKAIDQR